ncbi:MAG TPA: Gfo/Idh/MocA family oxidoreductase [Spirochaetia bacterium]|nr:Gfo/Idh/MocA family oxidoreductase [Spirochaetia bacterium]
MKAVIIGTSGHIDLALEVRDRLPQVSFVGVAPGSADEDAREFFVDQMEASLIPFYDDYRRMLDREKPNLAVVAPFFFLQSRIACECLERGIHVFVEKPMAVSLEQLERLRRAYAHGKAALCPMLTSRYVPSFHAAWRSLREGEVGEPLAITALKSYKMGTRHPMYTHRATYGGTIPWVAIHGIDWIHWFASGGITEVSASHTTRGNGGHGEMESSGVCLFRLANSGSASLSFDYFRPGSAPSHGEDRLRVAGEKGVLEVAGADAMLFPRDGAPRLLEKEPPLSLFQEFVRYLEQGTPVRLSAEDAFDICELALRCRDAADSRSAVSLRAASGSPASARGSVL